jgi:hypothetical protein
MKIVEMGTGGPILTDRRSGLSFVEERKRTMLNGTLVSALPPFFPLVTNAVHTAGWILLVALVTLPAIALAANAFREAAPGSRPGRPGRLATLCTASV